MCSQLRVSTSDPASGNLAASLPAHGARCYLDAITNGAPPAPLSRSGNLLRERRECCLRFLLKSLFSLPANARGHHDYEQRRRESEHDGANRARDQNRGVTT
jgi:hypothetical protein